jgi:hypothetical protein
MPYLSAMDNFEFTTDSAPESNSGALSRTSLLSSNYTLFWRVFFPIFSTVFLFGLMVAFYLTEENEMLFPLVPVIWARIGIVVVMLLWMFLLYRTLWRLKRVDADTQHLYVTNYWHTVRYPWIDVESLEVKNRLGRHVWQIVLKAPGRFGQTIYFFPSAQTAGFVEALGVQGLLKPTKA